ncbi:MAG: hypothetical protein WCJ01_01970 [Ignavibacteria bacterium]
MKFDWTEYLNQTLNVTMIENYGMKFEDKSEQPLYEIVFKTGRLIGAFEDGLLLEAARELHQVKIFIPYSSVKCVEIFNV